MNSNLVMPICDEYIPPNTVYVPTTTYNSTSSVDFAFMGTRYGSLKLLQQLFICFGTITFIWGVTDLPEVITPTMLIGFFLYLFLISTLLPVVHVLMWFYILHKVEKYSKYPWYAIELTISGIGAAVCLLCSFAPLFTLINTWSILMAFALISTLFAVILFGYNFYLVNQKKKMKIPLQATEFSMFTSNRT